jgi:hypothetical protein
MATFETDFRSSFPIFSVSAIKSGTLPIGSITTKRAMVDFMSSLTKDVFEIALNDDNNSFPRTAKISKGIVYVSGIHLAIGNVYVYTYKSVYNTDLLDG